MPLSPALAAWLADHGHDAVHAADLGLQRETDVAIMVRATRDGTLARPRLLAP
jgi:predicted nuclease of predicted toxin-antitoxin system